MFVLLRHCHRHPRHFNDKTQEEGERSRGSAPCEGLRRGEDKRREEGGELTSRVVHRLVAAPGVGALDLDLDFLEWYRCHWHQR